MLAASAGLRSVRGVIPMATFFSDFFNVDQAALDEYGAFDVSLINDLPLFIDPFLLFNSEIQQYQELHAGIIRYLTFLRDRSLAGPVSEGLLRGLFCFPEVKQNWLGFSMTGNSGTGLGIDFARALRSGLNSLFDDFGSEKITHGSHLEKVCLLRDGIGRDNISDFTTNLIKDFLCNYTQAFALERLSPADVREVAVAKAKFDYDLQVWRPGRYKLPWINGDFVILTPKDILTRDENWINRADMIRDFETIPPALSDLELRGQVSDYFERVLFVPKDREPTQRERGEAAARTILKFPQLLDYYIRSKEDSGDEAASISQEKVAETELFFNKNLAELQLLLSTLTEFYRAGFTTYQEAHRRLAYLKDVIENKGGHRIFYHDGKVIEREKDLQILYRLVWFGTPSDVGAEANDGRGPVDYKISRGAKDKTLVEMKLAKNSQLERNLSKQVPIYQAASDAKSAIKAIIFFSEAEEERVASILARLGILGHKDIVLIDARDDNKPSGSKA